MWVTFSNFLLYGKSVSLISPHNYDDYFYAWLFYFPLLLWNFIVIVIIIIIIIIIIINSV